MLKLKLQYFGHLMRRNDSFEKTLMLGRLEAGREGDNRGWDGWMASLTQWTWVWVNSGSWWWTGRPGVLRFMESQRVGHDWVTELMVVLFLLFWETSMLFSIVKDSLFLMHSMLICIGKARFLTVIFWDQCFNPLKHSFCHSYLLVFGRAMVLEGSI